MNVRIKMITPIRVPHEELERRQGRYRALAPDPLEIDVVNLPSGPEVPDRLESEASIRASEDLVYEEGMRTQPDRYDAILADCVLDPALERLERDAAVPVLGILRISAGHLASFGHRFGAVARHPAIGEELEARLRSFGFGHHCAGVRVLGLELGDISEGDRWNLALEPVTREFEAAGATSVLNGCSAVEVRFGDGIPVIDPTALTLELTGLAARRSLVSSPRSEVAR